jgi:hypothetical protein
MTALFSSPKTATPKTPPKQRMPTQTSTDVADAVKRRREMQRRRAGRDSTILTDSLSQITGSSGDKLGG